jgi:hypothetical protein
MPNKSVKFIIMEKINGSIPEEKVQYSVGKSNSISPRGGEIVSTPPIEKPIDKISNEAVQYSVEESDNINPRGDDGEIVPTTPVEKPIG